MKWVMLYQLYLILLVCCSCSNNNRVTKEVRALSGREITFPNGYTSLSFHDSMSVDSLLRKNIKMVSYIDNLPCTSCGISMLHDWIDNVKQIDPDVTYLIIVQTEEEDILFRSIDSMHLPCPLMYYDTPIFGEVNRLDVLARNKTFLLNKDNRIVLVGEPFNNERLSLLYKETIASLRNNYAHKKITKKNLDHTSK